MKSDQTLPREIHRVLLGEVYRIEEVYVEDAYYPIRDYLRGLYIVVDEVHSGASSRTEALFQGRAHLTEGSLSVLRERACEYSEHSDKTRQAFLIGWWIRSSKDPAYIAAFGLSRQKPLDLSEIILVLKEDLEGRPNGK